MLIGEVSEVKKVDESVSVDDRREILSRVVNLQEEIEKEKHSSPKKVSPLKERVEKIMEVESHKASHERPLLSTPYALPNPRFSGTQTQKSAPPKRKSSPLLLSMIV